MAPYSVGIGELQVSKKPGDVISALGLGSCVAIVLHDPRTGTIGMLHALLPESEKPGESSKPARFVDPGLPNLLKRMDKIGVRRNQLSAVLVGGAAMFEFTGAPLMDIGARNVATARKLLAEYGIPIVAEDVGGNRGRTVTVQVGEGSVTVRADGNQKCLICLGEKAEYKLAA